MARFNPTKRSMTGGDTVNLAGGQAYSLDNKQELVNHLLTSFVQDQYYRSAAQGVDRLVHLIETGDPQFAAKAAIYARNNIGMRSVSHVVAGEVARLVKGANWTADFFNRIVRRPDDMLEIMAYFTAKHGVKKTVQRKRGSCEVYRNIPNALKKGFRAAIGRFDGYQLAKYRGDDKDISLIDLVRFVHAPATERNKEALDLLVKGDLKSTETWESMLTQAGQKAENADELMEFKGYAWEKLIMSRKLPYFALLRNLRNIAQQAPKLIDAACEMLCDESLIRKSLVLPFRFFTAYNELQSAVPKQMLDAISAALMISCQNIPQLDGRTLIVLDDSGSMVGGRIGGERSTMDPATAGALLSALLMYRNPHSDFMMFNTNARYVSVKKDTPVLDQVRDIVRVFQSAGTDFKCIFRAINKPYDRIVIFSDMQGWVGYNSPSVKGGVFDTYKKKYNVDPFVYSIDLQGYGTSQFDPNSQKTFPLAGFSEKIFDVMKLLEMDRKALVNEIEKVEFTFPAKAA